MNNKKYEILMDEENTIECEGHILHRIKALRDFGDVRKGDIGGFVEKETNLSHEGNCWIYDDAKVYDDAEIYDNVRISDNAKVYGNSKVYRNARVFGKSHIYNNAEVFGNARVFGNAQVFGNAEIYGNVKVFGESYIYNNAEVFGNARVFGDTQVFGNAKIYDKAKVYGEAFVFGDAKIIETIIGKVNYQYDDIIEIQNPKGRLVTAILKDGEIYYTVGCQTNITEKEFRWRIENTEGGLERNPHRKFYYKIIDMVKLCFANNK